MLLADNDEASVRVTFKNIGEQRTSGLARGVGVNYVNLRLGRLERSKVGRERGFKLLADDLEIGLGQNAFELAQHQRVWRQEAYRQLSGSRAFGSHFCLC